MAVIKFEEVGLRTRLSWFILIYPTHLYNQTIPKVALTEHKHYWFCIAVLYSGHYRPIVS